MTPSPTRRSAPTRASIQAVILTTLAETRKTPVSEVQAALVAAGPEMPLDSLESVEIMLSLEEAFEVRFPESSDTCLAFQSVKALSRLVEGLVEDREGDQK